LTSKQNNPRGDWRERGESLAPSDGRIAEAPKKDKKAAASAPGMDDMY
jgi:hypothetical protein